MDDYGGQDSSNVTDTYASNSYSDNNRGGGYENDRSNDFSLVKENDSSPMRYEVHIEPETHRSSNNDDYISRSNAHESSKNNDLPLSKENGSTSITNQTHADGHTYHAANNDDLISDMKEDSNSDSEDLPSKNGIETCKSDELDAVEHLHLKNINFKSDQYSQNANEDARSDRFMNINDSGYDNDCCSCKNSPLMCLAFFCDCFGL